MLILVLGKVKKIDADAFSRTMGTPKPLLARRRGGAVNAVESLRRCEQNRLPNDFIFATTAERESARHACGDLLKVPPCATRTRLRYLSLLRCGI